MKKKSVKQTEKKVVAMTKSVVTKKTAAEKMGDIITDSVAEAQLKINAVLAQTNCELFAETTIKSGGQIEHRIGVRYKVAKKQA